MASSKITPLDSRMALAQQYLEENGHCYGCYCHCLLPVDDIEQERLDIMHKFFIVAREGINQGIKRSQNGLHPLPISCNGPPRILDLDCGTGIWCIDIADLYPGASILGWNLNMRMQPQKIAPGMQFLPRDITDPTWDLDPNSIGRSRFNASWQQETRSCAVCLQLDHTPYLHAVHQSTHTVQRGIYFGHGAVSPAFEMEGTMQMEVPGFPEWPLTAVERAAPCA
ncbi:methyltransferase LaeA- variant [Apiospora arundinis]